MSLRRILVARFVLALMLACAWQGVRADTPIRLFKSFVGNVNFVGTQQTVRDRNNKKPCQVFSPADNRFASISGIPSTATIISAQLYWAGSNYNPDYTVFFDNVPVTAVTERRYYSTTIGNNFNYYSGAADVTAQVKSKRNGRYAFRGLTVDNNEPYCSVEGVLGGFSLLVIYSDTSQPFRLLNLYEGFQHMRYTGITLNLSGFRVPNPLGTATGRVGHITWEGDATLQGYGENLRFNGIELTDSLNPRGNQFNSSSSIDGDDQSYGIDFDAYTVGSGVIKPGDTTASTRYETGQDLVLLSAEIVALPNVPLADLLIEMTRNNELAFGQDVGYSITVSNKGPSTAASPTVVTNTLSDGLTFVSARGKGWSCGAVGQEVTCTNTDTLASGTSLPVLTITATVGARGTITNSAVVTGKTFDPETTNNAASAKGTVAGESGFVFTDVACKDGIAFGHFQQPCTTTLPPVKAGVETDIFITAVSGGVPTKLSASKATPVSLRFALSCHQPANDAGVKARYAGVDMNLCAKDANEPTAWSGATTVSIPADVPSVAAKFHYDDVGKVQLYLQSVASNAIGTALPFVSAPYAIRLTGKGGAPFGASPLDQGAAKFARAGELFEMTVGSYTEDGKITPNFGAENSAAFDKPVIERGALPGSPAFAAMVDLPALQGNFGGIVAGKATGTQFHWDEVGVIKLTPKLSPETYLTVPVTNVPAYIGRFVPHHFVTSATQMDCVANMKCDDDIATAAYSGEPLSVKVAARAAGGTATKNYQGVFAHQVGLTAWTNPGPTGKNLPDPKDNMVERTAFKTDADGTAEAAPAYSLPNAFIHTAPRATWSAPTSIFLRATETGADGVTSEGDDGANEVGIRIVNGRLLVPNAHGSERLDLPLKVSAQYWTGTHWELSKNDQDSEVDAKPANTVFLNFYGGLKSGALSLLPQSVLKLADGSANYAVKVSPAASGSADLLINGVPWLPSTKGRLTFGTYKSPLIYMREVH